MIRIIRTRDDYEAALTKAEELSDSNPVPGTREFETLELLALLIEDYEDKTSNLGEPTSIEAIRFRMDQLGLTAKDLTPFIGSRSKVSEILAGKRPLTLPMIRALHDGLDIPVDALVRPGDQAANAELDWQKFPVRELIRRGWVSKPLRSNATELEAAIRAFFEPLGPPQQFAVLFRRSTSVRAAKAMDPYALTAWAGQVAREAVRVREVGAFDAGAIDQGFLSSLLKVSVEDSGPLLARELLAKKGIILVVVPQLPRTSVDGAAFRLPDRRPVIGMTLRHDRIDNFWFCLLHEVAHVKLHLSKTGSEDFRFFDDLDAGNANDAREQEADAFAGEALIPEAEWRTSAASKVRAVPAVIQLATRLRIHPAIVAGRIRHQYRDFRVLSSLVGQGQVRRLFLDSANFQ